MSINAISWLISKVGPNLQDHTAFRVLMVLCDHADTDGRGAYPSATTIADLTGMGMRTVREKLAWLETAGLITRGDQTATAYIPANRRPVVWDMAMQATHPNQEAHEPRTVRSNWGAKSAPQTQQPAHEPEPCGWGAESAPQNQEETPTTANTREPIQDDPEPTPDPTPSETETTPTDTQTQGCDRGAAGVQLGCSWGAAGVRAPAPKPIKPIKPIKPNKPREYARAKNPIHHDTTSTPPAPPTNTRHHHDTTAPDNQPAPQTIDQALAAWTPDQNARDLCAAHHGDVEAEAEKFRLRKREDEILPKNLDASFTLWLRRGIEGGYLTPLAAKPAKPQHHTARTHTHTWNCEHVQTAMAPHETEYNHERDGWQPSAWMQACQTRADQLNADQQTAGQP